MHNKLEISRSKNLNNLGQKLSRKSIGSDNLHVPLTSSVFLKIRPSVSRSSSARYSKWVTKKCEGDKYATPDGVSRLRISSDATPTAELPENVAVHFASFYKDEGTRRVPHSGDEKPTALEKGSKNSQKMEFTRQMVHKLENSAGTQNYVRQVSALLENTVEAPGFDMKIPPADNCAPEFGKSRDYFPLWYKDPSKMPVEPSRNRRYLKNECREIVKRNKGNDGRKTSSEESLTGSFSSDSDAEVKLEEETECEKVGMRTRTRIRNSWGRCDEEIIGGAKSHLSTSSSRSSSRSEITRRQSGSASASGPRDKRLRNSRFRNVVESKLPISASFSGRSWTTLTYSREREVEETEEEEEEGGDSVDWETTEDEDAEVGGGQGR